MIEASTKSYDPAITIAAPTTQESIWIRKPAHSWGWDIMYLGGLGGYGAGWN